MDASVSLHSPPCPICGGQAFRTVLQRARDFIWRKPGEFQIQRCVGCELVQTRPRPTPDSLGFYYEGTYSGEGEEGMRKFQTESGLGKLIATYRLSVMARVRELRAEDHVLDVGCSYGGFLRAARARSGGCATSGIDVDEGSIEAAVDKDLCDYKAGFLVDADYAPESFSVITFWESLEHHSEPVEALKRAHALLKPGGMVVIEVPNWGGLWRRVFRTSWLPLLIPQHLFHFTPRSLKRCLEAAGFEQVERQQTMFYPLEGIASLGIWLGRVLRSPPPGSKPSWRTPFDLTLLLILVVLYPIFEIPSQALLRALGLAGHQIAIARKQ